MKKQQENFSGPFLPSHILFVSGAILSLGAWQPSWAEDLPLVPSSSLPSAPSPLPHSNSLTSLHLSLLPSPLKPLKPAPLKLNPLRIQMLSPNFLCSLE